MTGASSSYSLSPIEEVAARYENATASRGLRWLFLGASVLFAGFIIAAWTTGRSNRLTVAILVLWGAMFLVAALHVAVEGLFSYAVETLLGHHDRRVVVTEEGSG